MSSEREEEAKEPRRWRKKVGGTERLVIAYSGHMKLGAPVSSSARILRQNVL